MLDEPKIHSILGIDIKCLSWSLNVNDHLTVYDTIESYGYDEDIIEGLDLNGDMYYLRIYPHTPVGFVDFGANTLSDLIIQLAKWSTS